MRRWVVALVVALLAPVAGGGCSAPPMFAPVVPDADPAAPDAEPGAPDADLPDADPDAPDAGVDAPTPGPDLIALCGAAPQSLADWERCYQKRRCEWAVECQFAGRYASVEECMAWPSLVEGGDVDAEGRSRAYAVAAGRARIDVATFARCLAATGADRCSTAYLEPSCKTRLVGTVDDGGACVADVECTSPGATCVRACADACCEGTCRPAYAEGETCDLFESCQPGFQCNFAQGEGSTFRCIAGDIGTWCWHHGDCDPAGWCDTAASECKPDLGDGDACTTLQQCGGGTECVGLQRRLAPAECRRVSEPGDICDSVCRGNLYCALPPDRSQWGTCVEVAKPGGLCGSSGPYCSASHACQGGTCVARATAGESCSRLPCLPDLICGDELPPPDGGPVPAAVCVRPQAAGARCDHPQQCTSYRCSGDASRAGVCLPGPAECAAR